jgi:pSer/pThr/pTyr-binding forkhead associated (FHA) protein
MLSDAHPFAQWLGRTPSEPESVALEHALARGPVLAHVQPRALALLALGDRGTARVGNDRSMDLRIADDPFVSAEHVRLRDDGRGWTIEDARSTNGTWLRDRPLREPELLRHGDQVRLARDTHLLFLSPRRGTPLLPSAETLTGASRRELEVLAALAAPIRADVHAVPESDAGIALALSISVSTVRTHVKSLYRKTGIDPALPPAAKRQRLALVGLRLPGEGDARPRWG